MRHPKFITRPADSEQLKTINSSVTRFLSMWYGKPSLAEMSIKPSGQGVPDDIGAMDYAIYESLHEIFFDSFDDFVSTGAGLLGNCLVRLAGFEWCQLQITKDTATIGLSHPECNVIAPIRELITFKYTSDLAHEESFKNLFFDILFSEERIRWTHPLIAAELNYTEGEADFKQKYGYEIPKYVQELYDLYSLPDENFLLRQLGMDAYDWCANQNWDQLVYYIESVNYFYTDQYGADWQKRFTNV